MPYSPYVGRGNQCSLFRFKQGQCTCCKRAQTVVTCGHVLLGEVLSKGGKGLAFALGPNRGLLALILVYLLDHNCMEF